MAKTRSGLEAPGLEYRKRQSGPAVPVWIASRDARAAGYPIRSRNLSGCIDDAAIAERCISLQVEMMQWLAKRGERDPVYDRTVRSLIDIYRTHPESPFHALRPSSRHPYEVYMTLLRAERGERRIDVLTGIDLKRWFREWSQPRKPGGAPMLGKAAMIAGVLKAVVKFGVVARLAGCLEFYETIRATKLPSPPARTEAPTAADVDLLRRTAHQLGVSSVALTVAFQFEGAIRLWDVIGQWLPMSDPIPSAYLHDGRKWCGLSWENIDSNNMLSLTPSKTRATTGKKIALDLNMCPMILEEIAQVPEELRTGPIIIDEFTGHPFREERFRYVFKKVRKASGLSKTLWARDIRAGALTEASQGGATSDDRAKVGAHSKEITARVYDRDTIEAARRVRTARMAFRAKKDGA